ncbi:WD40/YVTN/BNR-like repeat-containing protein [Dactylosporangium sp. CS-047395]|uniref:WD40/YVTN/BNR-like repeat-containing protein n=1 Tax=Dactylosporangium sp. CS-047395 TaxID=3239936 RepID=UPI003D922B02
MSDQTVEDEFARFAQDWAGTFRPVPVEAMRTWRRTRRRGLLWLGGLGAAIVAALTVNALQPATAPERPLVADRVVRLEGARGTMAVRFVDRDHGWVLFSDCTPGVGCARTMGRTADAGLTWTPVALPADLPALGTAQLLLQGQNTFLIGTSNPYIAWWSTEDGGRTYRQLPPESIAGVPDIVVERLGGGPPPTPWRLTPGNLDTTVAYSPDGGMTWRDLQPRIGPGAVLRVGPGGEAWAVAGQPSRVWRLTPDGPVALESLPITVDAATISPIGDGGLIVLVPGRGVGVLRAGTFTPLPAPLTDAMLVTPLDDGTVVLMPGDGSLVVGSGRETWVRYVRP